MRYILPLIFTLFIASTVFADTSIQTFYASAFFNPEIIQIENIFKTLMTNENISAAFTKVPRGLIVSVEESVFFKNGDINIKPQAYELLDGISAVLNKFENRCVIESHTDEPVNPDSIYKENWEISLQRSNKIADYLVRTGKVKKERIFPVGFGEIMPFKENVAEKPFSDSRIDFVIIDYALKR